MNIILLGTLCVVIGLFIGYVMVDKSKNKTNIKATTKNKVKPKKQYSKLIVSFVIALNIIFTLAILFVFLQTGNEPTVLVGCWFAFTTGELWMLSSIKKTKSNKIKDEINEFIN